MLRPLLLHAIAVLFLLGSGAGPRSASAQVDGPDAALPDGSGHFYQQANGLGGQGDGGYAITDAGGIPFWTVYQQLGGPSTLGYPASQRFRWDGFTVQVMQKVVFQWHPETRQVMFVNVLDRMHDSGHDDWLLTYRQTPRPFDTAPDSGLPWSQVEQRHWHILDGNAAIKVRYFADPDPIDHFGLPMGSADEGNSVVIRCQRAVFQFWKEDVPWARAGEVTIANGGDLAKEVDLFPTAALVPQTLAAATTGSGPTAPRSHDWRTPGFVSAVGGTLYDPWCIPLRSVGSNVPNLPFRDGVTANLEWMRQHHLRWLRVFATGHGLGPDRAPRSAAQAITALQALLGRVAAFNAGHDPAAAIYVLVSLTDYYPPGVPGDGHAYDHPTFSLSPVLPAPWYRAGVASFDFEQEHGFGLARDLPNYEVNYKPWVEQVVPALAGSPALMGWQLGNELKARGSPRNGISSEQAYGWYLAFSKDIVDTIRARDHNHLIFMGAQYMAELTDWEYRPKDTLALDRVPEYRQLVQRMLDDCGSACWNVWSLTAYDFNPYSLDDARTFGQSGIAVVATEYGFTLGTPAVTESRYGGDRAGAVQSGWVQPWQEVDGMFQPRRWSVSDLLASTALAGVAPWGSPAPGSDAGLDEDGSRGITGTPDEAALWAAWGSVAARTEATNRAAGPSTACQALRSS